MSTLSAIQIHKENAISTGLIYVVFLCYDFTKMQFVISLVFQISNNGSSTGRRSINLILPSDLLLHAILLHGP